MFPRQADKRHIIAERIGAEWHQVGATPIAEHRKRYDAGVIEMAQGRVNGRWSLFAIPRQARVDRKRRYFVLETPSGFTRAMAV